MRCFLGLAVSLALLCIASCVQNWKYEEEPAVFQPTPSTSEDQETLHDPKMQEVLKKISNKDSNLTEVLSDLEILVQNSPNTPANLNFSSLVRQLETEIRKNVSQMLEEYISNNGYQNSNYGSYKMVRRYKRSNESYAACVNTFTQIASIAGGTAGAALGAVLFSVIPVIGTIIGGYLGARLGAQIGTDLGGNLAASNCPK